MANPLFPNVPQVPGVPAVFRDPTPIGSAPPIAPRLAADSPGVAAASRTNWGVYTAGGALALAVDSVVMIEPGREARISDYPQEAGGFQSFNKVMVPGTARMVIAKGGSDADRQAFLIALDAMIETTDLFTIVMPDQTLRNRNLIRYEFPRSAERGVTLLSVEVIFEEVRTGATAAFSDSKQPSGNNPVQGGPVQATTPTAAQQPSAAPPSANPAVEAVPPIDASMTQAERAATVSTLIEAGASIGDLVTKGVSFQAVPTLVTAAQSLTTQLGGQAVTLDITQRDEGLFTDVYVNDALIIGGVLVQNDNAIVRSAYLGFAGDLYFHDTQGGLSDPSYSDLGRLALLYAGA